MLTWNSLTKSQKRWVEHFAKLLPECVEKGYITGVQCRILHKKMKKERAAGGPVFGKANWLFRSNKLKRGLYLFPADGVTVQKAMNSISGQNTTITVPISSRISEDDKSFFNDIKAFGIDIKYVKNS
jgi:hypothetical protein